jgi:hypothetical protein
MSQSQGQGVDPVFATTTPIRYRDVPGGGTGFFLNHNGNTFLITNRHVVDPEDSSPEQARIWFRNFGNLAQTNHHDISLTDGEGIDWYGHPESEEVDLAVVPLNPVLSSMDEAQDGQHKTGSLAFTTQHYLPDAIQVDNRVLILGYPGDFIDRTTFFPVRRNALIASPYGVNFNGWPFFVTDARMHPGTSGSPVVFQPRGMIQSSGDIPDGRHKQVYLLGVHSATFYQAQPDSEPENQLWENQENESEDEGTPTKYELNVAWYPELINQIFHRI